VTVGVFAGSAGTFTTDASLVVQSWDEWLTRVTGLGEAETCGRPLGELFPELEARGLLARLGRVAESGEVAVLAPAFHEYFLPCPPRVPATHFARMQQHVTMVPLRAGERIAGVMVTIEDVTARRDRERELARQLDSPDDAIRLRAARALAEEDGAGPLVGVLGDPSWRVRRAAADGLARERDDAAAETLVAAIRERHRDPATLNAALHALVKGASDALPSVAPLLSADDADLRTYAALALGLIEDPRAVPLLVRALCDADDNVRFHAVEALGRIGSREAASAVAELAESRDFAVAFAALDALASIGERSAAPRLLPLLDDPLLQGAAAEAIGALGGDDAAAPLARLLNEPHAPLAAVTGALAALDARSGSANGSSTNVARIVAATLAPAGLRALVAALRSVSEAERPALVRVLGWLDGDDVDTVLAAALSEAATRDVAADALVRRGARAVPALLEVLAREHHARDDDAGDAGDADDAGAPARRAAAAALGRLGATSAVPALVSLLDDVPDVAVVAAGALGHIGDRRAFEPLLARLDDAHAAVRQVAVSALHSIGHRDMSARLPALLAHDSPRVRESAARIAGYLGDASVLEPLLALCDDADDAVRRAAVEQLSRFDDPRARAALRKALEAGEPGTRAAAARALAYGLASDATPWLVAACRDADPWVRYYAARAFRRLATPDSAASLLELALHDRVPPVRIAAVEALAALGDDERLAALRPLADDPDPAVAGPALLALGAARDTETLAALHSALTHAARVCRVAALDALGRRGDAASVDAIAVVARSSADAEERALALAALASIPGERAVSALVDVAEDPKRCAAVVEALARLPEERIAWLRPALAHPRHAVRNVVIEALGRSDHASAGLLLADALRDEHAEVRAAAEYALARRDLRATTAGA
jgi:HEAT repeat protein